MSKKTVSVTCNYEREREREKERQTERQTERERKTEFQILIQSGHNQTYYFKKVVL